MTPLTLVGRVLTSLTTGCQHGNNGVNLDDGEMTRLCLAFGRSQCIYTRIEHHTEGHETDSASVVLAERSVSKPGFNQLLI